MKTSQFRWIGPINLTDFSEEGLELIRNSASRPGSKIKHVIIKTCEGAPPTLYAKATEKLSAVMWRKQLGGGRLNETTITQLVGAELASIKQTNKKAKPLPGISKQSSRGTQTDEQQARYVPPAVQQDVCRVFMEVGAETLFTLQALRRDQITAGNATLVVLPLP